MTGGASSAVHRHCVTSREIVCALADWLAGSPWALEEAVWTWPGNSAARIRDGGDKLVLNGVIVATRNPGSIPATAQGAALPHLNDALAIARVAMRGAEVSLEKAQRE